MSIIRKRFTLGVELSPTDLSSQDLSREGELAYDSDSDKLKYRNASETKEVVNTDESQVLENKTIDASSTGNNSITIDSDSAKYDDTIETVISLLKSNGVDPVENLQEAVDAIKRALDNQNDASEIGYDATASGLDTGDDSSNVQDAIDDLDANVDDLVTLSGVAENSTNLGAFTGSTITDDQDIKSALQEVETAIEARALGTDLQDHIDATAAHGVGEVVGTSEAQDLSNKAIIDPTRLDVKKDLLADLETYALTASDGQIVFATDEQEMFQVISGELQPIGGGGSTQFEISQVAHGFVVGDGIYHNGTSWVKGQADDANTLAYHVVIEVKSVDIFIAADFGRVEVPSHGFTVGQYYFLSDSVAGQPTATEPSTFSNPLFYVESADILQIKCLRPEVVGADTNLDDLSDVSVSTAVEGDIIKYDGASWQATKQDQVVVSLVAAENVVKGDALYINGSGEVALVDVDDDNKVEFIGFARNAASVSQSVEIVVSGKLGGFTGLTAGEFVYVDPSNPGKLVQPEPTQANVYLIKAGKAISATEILVNADLAASAEFNREVVADLAITNNQSVATAISGLIFSGLSYRAVVLRYSIYRVTDDNEVAQTGQLRLTYKTNAGTWSLSDDFGGDDAGVTFSVDGTGQILYTSSDLTGANYDSKLQVSTVELFEV